MTTHIQAIRGALTRVTVREIDLAEAATPFDGGLREASVEERGCVRCFEEGQEGGGEEEGEGTHD